MWQPSVLCVSAAFVLANAATAFTQPPSPARLIQVVDAQHLPDRQKVIDTAMQINLGATGIPAQTIEIGRYDGSTREFVWALPDLYPPGLPNHKKEEYGGDVPPQHFAPINSFDVTYRFSITNKPANLAISVQVPNADGTLQSRQATISADGGSASIAFNPHTTQVQQVRISHPGTVRTLRVRPYLRPQLGAFVVPHLLLAIVYEPPGSQSSASFAMSHTTGTSVRFESVGGSSLIDVEDTGKLLATLAGVGEGGSGALAFLGSPVGWQAAGSAAPYVAAFAAVVQIIDLMTSSQTTTTIEVETSGTSQMRGWSLTAQRTYSTGSYQYPGAGDKFIILDDVLFVYAVVNSRVMLAPVAFTQDRSQTLAQLESELPASYVQKLRELDAMVTPPPPAQVRPTLRPSLSHSVPRLQYFTTARCEIVGPTSLDLTQTQTSGNGTVNIVTKTTQITHQPSLLHQLLGTASPDTYLTTYYSNRVENWVEQTQSTSITLGCPEFAPVTRFVEVSIDNAFGTFVSRLAGEAPATASLTGELRDRSGRTTANRALTLQIGDRLYSTRSDATGKFAFYTETIPRAGTLRLGKTTRKVSFNGRPVTNLVMTHR